MASLLVLRPRALSNLPRGLAPCAAALCLLHAGFASAHIELLSPLPRYESRNVNKSCPCGAGSSSRSCNVERDGTDAFRSACVTTFEAGSTVTIRFDEYVDHGGRYRVALDPVGSDFYDFNEHILLDVPDPRDGAGNTGEASLWELEVTLPEEPCEQCTLQLIQAMHGDTANEVPDTAGLSSYYVCADIRIVPRGEMPAAGAQPEPSCYDEPGFEFDGPTNEVPTKEPEPTEEAPNEPMPIPDNGSMPASAVDSGSEADPSPGGKPPSSAEPAAAPPAAPSEPSSSDPSNGDPSNGDPSSPASQATEGVGSGETRVAGPAPQPASGNGCNLGRVGSGNRAFGALATLLAAIALGAGRWRRGSARQPSNRAPDGALRSEREA